MRRARRSLSAVGCVAVVMGLLLSTVADAKIVHPFTESFNGAATPAASFTPLGVAVDPSSHDLYVSDSTHKLIDKLSSSGTYLCQITGKGANNPSPPGSECDTNTSLTENPPVPGGALLSALAQGIVDPGGALLFPDFTGHVIDRFAAAGTYLSQLTVPASGKPSQVALDAAGNLYVADTANHLVDKYTIAESKWSTFAGPFASPGPSGVAVDNSCAQHEPPLTESTTPKCSEFDPSNGYVYVADPKNQAVDVFEPDRTEKPPITATPAGPLSTSLGKLATDPTDGHLFVPDTTNRVLDEFAPGGGFVSQTAVPAAPAASSPQGVAVDPASGTLYVADKENKLLDVFATAVVPDVTTEPATGVEETAATLNGEVGPDAANGGGNVTSCHFEYGTTTTYTSPPAACLDSSNEEVGTTLNPITTGTDVHAAITTLSPATTYHFRLTAANANAIPSHGEDETLTTAGPPAIEAGSENSYVSGVNATLKAKINPFGLDTACEVQYVEAAAYNPSAPNPYGAGQTAPCTETLGAGFGDQAVRAQVNGLRVGTTYHYRFLATNSAPAGTAAGEDKTLVTFGVHSLEYEIIGEEGEGHPYTQAGGHPYELRTGFKVNETENVGGEKAEVPTGNLKTVVSELPAGLIGDPSATPRCSRQALGELRCSGAGQVGVMSLELGSPGTGFPNEELVPLFNIKPPKGIAAEFGATILQHVNVYIDAKLRPDGNYAVTAESPNNSNAAGVSEVYVHLWGVPAFGSKEGEGHFDQRFCTLPSGRGYEQGCTSFEPLKPFLANPTSCGGPLTTTLSFDSWQAQGLFDEHAVETEPITGCNQLDFSPKLEARPTTNLADSPAGLSVDLKIPQNEDPKGKAEADLKDTVVTLPRGITVNPAAASGLEACSSAQIGLVSKPGQTPIRFSAAPPNCPDAAKIGTVEVLTPLLREHDEAGQPTGLHPLPGAVYLAAPHDNPFDSLLAIYIAIDDPETGIVVKLAGHVVPDPVTGQLTASFEESPQLPFEDFKLRFFAGAHAALRTPPTCGTYETTSLLTPWSFPEGARATPSDAYQITAAPGGGACPATAAEEPHAPAFHAATESPQAGAYSPFSFRLARADGSQELKGINTTLPPGLTGKLAGIAECSDAQIAAAEQSSGQAEKARPSCPLSSEVGTVEVSSGTGPAPLYVTGHAYLSTPYKGAPLSLAIITPAVAGPFDLGTVVVRAALYVNPETAQIHAVSDVIPHILEGIPLDVRSVTLKMARPSFTLNPTSCNELFFNGSVLSVLNASAPLTQRFQVGGCAALGFKPKLSLRLKGATHRGAHPALRAVLTLPPGGANVARAQVTLPHSEFLDNAHIRTVCTRPQLASQTCPAGSIYGHATAVTPLLDHPLSGPVYLGVGFGHKLPDLVADLNGQIRVLLHGKVDTGREHGLRNTFEVVPDAPVSKFVLSMNGGKKGLIENSENLCSPKAKVHAVADFTGQNGKVYNTTPTVANSCKKKSNKSKAHRRHHR